MQKYKKVIYNSLEQEGKEITTENITEVIDVMLKWVIAVVFPAFMILWLNLVKIWGLPYGIETAIILALIYVFFGVLLPQAQVLRSVDPQVLHAHLR